jgi:putative membrane protein
MIGNLILRWLLNTVALLIVAIVVPHFSYDSLLTVAIAALVLGLLNAVVKPLLVIVTLPLTIVTLGLFLFVLNAFMLWLTSVLVPGFRLHGFGTALLASLMLSLVSMLWKALTRRDAPARA